MGVPTPYKDGIGLYPQEMGEPTPYKDHVSEEEEKRKVFVRLRHSSGDLSPETRLPPQNAWPSTILFRHFNKQFLTKSPQQVTLPRQVLTGA